MDRSFGLLKPDCLKRGFEGEVFKMIENAGLSIITSKRVRLTEDQVAGVWPTCVGEPFYQEMLEFSLSGDSIVFIVEGDNAIDRLSNLVGHYDPKIAKKRHNSWAICYIAYGEYNSQHPECRNFLGRSSSFLPSFFYLI